MVWSAKQAKGAASRGFAIASTRPLDASLAASADDIVGMDLLWRGNQLFFCAI